MQFTPAAGIERGLPIFERKQSERDKQSHETPVGDDRVSDIHERKKTGCFTRRQQGAVMCPVHEQGRRESSDHTHVKQKPHDC